MTATVSPARLRPPDRGPAAPAPAPGPHSGGRRDGAVEVALFAMTLAAGLGLCRLYADATFVPPVVLGAVCAHGLAAACRRRGVGPLLSLAVSAAGLALLVTWVIEPQVALVPGPAVWQAASADLNEAWRRFGEVVAPTEMTRGFALASVAGVWLAAFVGDLFAFRARARVEAMVPSFTVFLFGALLGGERNRLLAAAMFLAAALGFALLAEVCGVVADRSWVAGLRRPGRRALLRSGVGMAVVALGVGLVVGPRLPGAESPGLSGWRERDTKKGTRVTLSPLVDIRGRLVSQSNVEMFTVAAREPTYWRVTSLDRFDGAIWSSLSNYRPAGRTLPGLGPDDDRAQSVRSTQEFRISALASIWLPAAYRPERLSPTGDVRFDPDSASLVTDEATSDGLRYTVESALPRLSAAELATVGPAVPQDVADRYLDLPESISVRVRRTAAQVAGSEATPYARAKALQDWFRANFTYDLQVAPGHDDRAMDQFLTQRRGYCEQFAGTYAAMARLIGLPARVAVGFTSGTLEADGRWHVKGREAHAWPEVYLSGYGWVAFEPTPGRGLPGAEGYTEVPAAQAAPDTPTPAPAAAPTVPAPAEDQPEAADPSPVAGGGDTGGRRWSGLALVATAAAAWAIGVPAATRSRRRRRRAAATTPAQRVLAAWADAEDELAAAGLGRRPWETRAELARRVVRPSGGAGPSIARLADDASEAAWSPAGVAEEVARRAEAEAATVARQLRAQATWPARARRAVDPRPLFRPRPLLRRPPAPPGTDQPRARTAVRA